MHSCALILIFLLFFSPSSQQLLKDRKNSFLTEGFENLKWIFAFQWIPRDLTSYKYLPHFNFFNKSFHAIIPKHLVASQSAKDTTEWTPHLVPSKTNFASRECGARVLSSNPGAMKASSILVDDPDKYLINSCDAKKWIVIELCEEVNIESIELGNMEFFSSTPKDVVIYGREDSKKNSSSQWIKLGSIVANDLRQLQTFTLPKDPEKSRHWHKIIKLEFLSHYGTQSICPITSVKIYGVALLRDIKQDVLQAVNNYPKIESGSFPQLPAKVYEDIPTNLSLELSENSLPFNSKKQGQGLNLLMSLKEQVEYCESQVSLLSSQLFLNKAQIDTVDEKYSTSLEKLNRRMTYLDAKLSEANESLSQAYQIIFAGAGICIFLSLWLIALTFRRARPNHPNLPVEEIQE